VGTTGMFVKVIPLFAIIFMAFIALGTGQGILPSTAPVNDTSANDFSAILLALPPIMFAFDGFVYSASMQNEAKSQKTFMTA
jgi:amino acid transporter